MLMTSGLGGVFPAGYPVARVTEVHGDAVQPLAQVRAIPFAAVDTDTELMLVWFRDDQPASPTPAPTATGDLRTGNSKLQPQAAPPPRPKPLAPETLPTAPAPAGTGARNPEPSSGKVNPAAAAPSKSGASAAVKGPEGSTPAAPANSKDSVSGDNPRAATPTKPAPPAPPEPSPDATPRNP
jgi:rod shape-determining protein MreC